MQPKGKPNMRCHSQGLTIKLKRDVPLADIEQMIAGDHPWAKAVPNDRQATLEQLTLPPSAGHC